MKRAVAKFILSLQLILITLLASRALATQPDPAAVRLRRVDGVEQQMSEYIGKGEWVIANVWSPSCSFCLTELPEIEEFQARHKDEKVTILGITIDFPSFGYGRLDIIKAFLAKHPLDYPIFLADLNSASKLIGNRLVGIPTTVIYDPQGRVHARWAGDIDADEIEKLMQRESDIMEDWAEDF